MTRARRHLFSFLADWTIRLARGRPDREDDERRKRRMMYETDVSRFPLRMTSWLRDRLRRGWLSVKKGPPMDADER